MRINGRNRLACKTLIKDLDLDAADHRRGRSRACRSMKDLVVDMEPFFAAYREVHAVPDHRPATSRRAERLQSRRAPRALRRHHQVHPLRGVHLVVPGVLDRRAVLRPGRDRQRAPVHLRLAATRAATQRLEILNDKEGVWRCRTTFNCTEACPRGIEVTKAIQEVKRALITRKI